MVGGIGEDRAVAERPRAELHPARAAGHDAVRDQELRDALLDAVVEGHLVLPLEAPLADDRLRLLVGHRRAQVRRPERLRRGDQAAPRALLHVPEIGGADRVGLVAAGREGEQLLHPVLLPEQHVGLHVHEDAAAQREPPAAVALAHEAAPAQQHVLEQALGAARDPVEAQADHGAQQELVALALGAPAEARGPAFLEIEHLAQGRLRARRVLLRRVRGHAHHLVLVLAELHAHRERHERVEGAHRPRRARRGLVPLERRGLGRWRRSRRARPPSCRW